MVCLLLYVPPFHAAQVLHLVLVPVQGNVKVDGRISGLECSEDACVFNWIWMGNITDLEGHLERSSTFVSTYLHPDFILGNHAMSACFSLKYTDVGWYLQKGIIAYIFLPLILLQELEHLLTKIWHIAQSSWAHFLPTSLQWKRERESLRSQVCAYHCLCHPPHLPLTSNHHSRIF